MTKNELIDALADKLSIPRLKAAVVVETIFQKMTESLMQGDRIEIRGFGAFAVRSYEARKGRNPNTGRAVRVEAKKLPHFKMAKELKAELIEAYEKSLQTGDQK